MKMIGKHIFLVLLIASFAFTAYAGPTSSLFELDGVEDRSVSSDNGDYKDASPFGYTGSQYSGYYIGTVLSPKDDKNTLEALIRVYFDESYEISLWDKVDYSTGGDGEKGIINYSITEGLDPQGGDWKLLDDQYVINFYSVKGSNGFSLYYLDPELNDGTNGTWWTGHLLNNGGQNPSISHFSAVYAEGNNQPPENLVPEPATMILMGVGLLGLGFGLRKKNQQ